MTSVATVFIFLLWLILFYKKTKRGSHLNREEKVLAWLTLGLFIVSLILQVLEWSGITPSFLSPYLTVIVMTFVGSGLVITIILIVAWKRNRYTLDDRFENLTIHYSQRTDNPDTSHPARPRLVVDNRVPKRHYWVPTWLEPYLKKHRSARANFQECEPLHDLHYLNQSIL